MELARAYTGKQGLISFLGGHYGYSIGALSLIADRSENRRLSQPLIPGVVHVPYPYCYRCPLAQSYPSCDLACIEDVLDILARARALLYCTFFTINKAEPEY